MNKILSITSLKEKHPEVNNYIFWNKNSEQLQGTHEFTINFAAWGKSSPSGIHLFIDANGILLQIYVLWWHPLCKEVKESFNIFKKYKGKFSEIFELVVDEQF